MHDVAAGHAQLRPALNVVVQDAHMVGHALHAAAYARKAAACALTGR